MVQFWVVCMAMFLALIQLADATLCPIGCNCTDRKVMKCAGTGLNTMPMRISPIVCEFQANDNNITELPVRMLTNAKTLQKLSLSRNKIQNLRSSTFKNTNSLTYLDLSHNIIRTIRAYTFFELSKLRVLNLDGNNITGISERAFEHIESLRELILSNNKLRAIPTKLLEKQISLEVLKLDGNRISSLTNDVFRRQSALRVLSLSKNRIKRISVEVFGSLYLLQELRLDRNQIQEIDRGLTDKFETRCMNKGNSSSPTSADIVPRKVFAQMTMLEILDIGRNNLKIITYESFQELIHLKSPLLKKNPWRCDCALRHAVQSFPPTLREEIWDDAICNEPNELDGSRIGDIFLNEDLTSVYPAPLHVTDTTLSSKEPSITTKNDVSPMTSTIGRGVGSNKSHISETRRTTRDDSIPTVDKVFFKTLAVAITEESRTRGNDLEDSSDSNKSIKPDKWWMVAATSAAIFIVICGTLCGISKCLNKGHGRERSPCKRSRGDEISFRKSSSNSRFFDYQFANRPLPQAPNTPGRPVARNTPDEVRSSKRERCGSNTSGFIAMRTYSCDSNTKGHCNSNASHGKYQQGRTRSSTNASIETAETKFTDSNPSRNKLPPLPCENTDMAAALKPFEEMAATKTNRNNVTKLEDMEIISNGGNNTQQGINPPPPPKRTESSKLRCKELLRKTKLREPQIQEAYCEISAEDNGRKNESGENILYKKYLQKMIDPYYSSQFGLQNSENSPKHTAVTKSPTSNLFDDEHYDRLSYNTRRRYDDTIDRFMNSTRDSCFKGADNDFVFSRPTEEEKLRRSSTGRLFQLRKQKSDLQRRSMVVTKSPLTSESQSNAKDHSDTNHGVRAQSFSHAPRSNSANPYGNATPVIVVHEHDRLIGSHKDRCEIRQNHKLLRSHEYQHIKLRHSDALPQSKFISASEIPEERISDADTQDIVANHTNFDTGHLNLPHSKYQSNKSDLSDASQTATSDKEEMEELKSLVQSILRSEKEDSRPVSRADSIKDDSCVSRSNSNCGSRNTYLATPTKHFLNLSSEIDLTESDDAGYLSPLTTLRKKSNIEEEEIFGEIQYGDHHRIRNLNKRGSTKHKKATSGQRKTRKSSNNSASNSKEHYTSSESDADYDSMPRKRISKPPRHFQKQPTNRTPSETENSTVYMSIIDSNDPMIEPAPNQTNSDISNKAGAAFHSREREIYINASQSRDNENCYEEIYTRPNSINPQPNPMAHKPYFCALRTKRRPEENYYQEVTKVSKKRRRNKRPKSFGINFVVNSTSSII